MNRSLAILLVASVALTFPVRAETVRERDLDALVRRSSLVLRGEVVGLLNDGVDLHPLAVYLKKGELAPVMRIRPSGARQLTPALGERGLFFLTPAESSPGACAFVQEDSERWPIEPENDAAVDAFMGRLISSAFEKTPTPLTDVWLQGVELPVASLSAHSARQLAALARKGALSPKDWDRLEGFLAHATSDELSANVVGSLADVLPGERAATLLSKAHEGSKTKAALLVAISTRAAQGTGKAKAQAKAAIGAAQDGSPEIALAAASGLALLGDESAIPALDRALEAEQPTTRQGAVEALAALAGHGSRAARSRLHALFEDADGLVRARARQAWTEAYFADPMRQQRTRPSLVFVSVAAVLMLAVLAHAWIDHRRTR